MAQLRLHAPEWTAAGWSLKFTLVTRTGYQHGYSLPRMPVRGVPRTAPVKE